MHSLHLCIAKQCLGFRKFWAVSKAILLFWLRSDELQHASVSILSAVLLLLVFREIQFRLTRQPLIFESLILIFARHCFGISVPSIRTLRSLPPQGNCLHPSKVILRPDTFVSESPKLGKNHQKPKAKYSISIIDLPAELRSFIGVNDR